MVCIMIRVPRPFRFSTKAGVWVKMEMTNSSHTCSPASIYHYLPYLIDYLLPSTALLCALHSCSFTSRYLRPSSHVLQPPCIFPSLPPLSSSTPAWPFAADKVVSVPWLTVSGVSAAVLAKLQIELGCRRRRLEGEGGKPGVWRGD